MAETSGVSDLPVLVVIFHRWMPSYEFHAVLLDTVLSGFVKLFYVGHEPKTCGGRLVEVRSGDASDTAGY